MQPHPPPSESATIPALHMESGLGGEVLRDKRFVSVEFMYKPRPSDTGYDARRRRSVFDYALKSRLDELAHYPDSALILCCNDQRTADSLSDLREQYPTLPIYRIPMHRRHFAASGTIPRVGSRFRRRIVGRASGSRSNLGARLRRMAEQVTSSCPRMTRAGIIRSSTI